MLLCLTIISKLIKDKTVAEEGSYGELIEKNGLYKRMVDLQAKSANWNIV